MKKFINQVKDCLSPSSVYKNPESNMPGKAFGYIALLVASFALITAVIFGTVLAPILGEAVTSGLSIAQKYPTDLVLTLSKGSLSMNKPSPYAFPTDMTKLPKPAHSQYMVIDTTKSLSLETFTSADTYMFVGKDGLITTDKGAIKIQLFKNLPDHTLTRTEVDSFSAKASNAWNKFSGLIVATITIMAWIGTSVTGYVSALFFSLLGTLIVFIVTRIKGHKLAFSKIYALSLYTYTTTILLGFIKSFFGFSSWISFIVFVLILVLFVSKKEKTA